MEISKLDFDDADQVRELVRYLQEENSALRQDKARELFRLASNRLKAVMNDRGQVEYRFERSFGARMLGTALYRRVVQECFGSPVRLGLFVLVIYLCNMVLFASLFTQQVPKELFICALFIYCLQVLLGMMLFDSAIYVNVCLTFGNVLSVLFAMLAAALFAAMLHFDYRGIGMGVTFVATILGQIGLESWMSSFRKLVGPLMYITPPIIYAILISCLYMGTVSGADIFQVAFQVVVGVNGTQPIIFSTIGLFTQLIGVIVIFCLRSFVNSLQWQSRLPRAEIFLEGADEARLKGHPEDFAFLKLKCLDRQLPETVTSIASTSIV